MNAIAAVAAVERDHARSVARVAAANTIGCMLGSLGASLLLIPQLGSQHTQQVMMILSAYAGALLLMSSPAKGERARGRLARPVATALVVASGAIGLLLVTSVPQMPAVLVAYGKYAVTWAGHVGDVLFVGEGVSASVAVTRSPSGALNYHNAGKIQASSEPDRKSTRLNSSHRT